MLSVESLFLGDSLLINCTTDLAVISIELLDSSGYVLASGNGTHIIFEIAEVTKAHSNRIYTCRTFGPFGNQTDTVPLTVQIANNEAIIAGATTCVLLIILLIITSGTILIVIAIRK